MIAQSTTITQPQNYFIDHRIEAIERDYHANNTLSAYQTDISQFTDYFNDSSYNYNSLKEWLTHLAMDKNYKITTIQRKSSAIIEYFRAEGIPFNVHEHRKFMVSIKNHLKKNNPQQTNIKQAPCISQEDIQAKCKTLFYSTDPKDNQIQLIILLMYLGALRVSEVVNKPAKQFIRTPYGYEFHLTEGKTIKHGIQIKYYPQNDIEYLCPVTSLDRHLHAYKLEPDDCLLTTITSTGRKQKPMGPKVVWDALKRTFNEYPDITTHSLRASHVTHAHENNTSIKEIMNQTGHKSVEMVIRYDRASGRERNSVNGLMR